MSFVTAYRTIKPCVAAVIQTFYPAGRPDFPTILGTGFLASRLGLLCTCRHVADAVRPCRGLPVSEVSRRRHCFSQTSRLKVNAELGF